MANNPELRFSEEKYIDDYITASFIPGTLPPPGPSAPPVEFVLTCQQEEFVGGGRPVRREKELYSGSERQYSFDISKLSDIYVRDAFRDHSLTFTLTQYVGTSRVGSVRETIYRDFKPRLSFSSISVGYNKSVTAYFKNCDAGQTRKLTVLRSIWDPRGGADRLVTHTIYSGTGDFYTFNPTALPEDVLWKPTGGSKYLQVSLDCNGSSVSANLYKEAFEAPKFSSVDIKKEYSSSPLFYMIAGANASWSCSGGNGELQEYVVQIEGEEKKCGKSTSLDFYPYQFVDTSDPHKLNKGPSSIGVRIKRVDKHFDGLHSTFSDTVWIDAEHFCVWVYDSSGELQLCNIWVYDDSGHKRPCRVKG